MTERRYLIVIEGPEGESYSAYAPDLPGDAGDPIPEPSRLTASYVDVAA